METQRKCSANPIFVLIFAFLCSQGFKSSCVAAISTIRVGDELNPTWNLVSENGQFILGFFVIDATNSGYLGIWYTNDHQQRKVWVANPNTPITGGSGSLTIDNTGTLKITLGESTFLDLFVQNEAGNTTATLEDSGNFVLMDEIGRTLWESFDHPTNTLLPGMKLGYNLTSGRNWTLKSWLIDSIPSSGAFNLSLESSEETAQLVIHRRGRRYWTSGAWEDNKGFYSLPESNESTKQKNYNLSYISDRAGNYKYFIYYPIESNPNPNRMLELSAAGQIVDRARNRFMGPEICYGFENGTGCVDTTVPRCRSQSDIFLAQRAIFPTGMGSLFESSWLILNDCFERCWNDCSCVAFDTYYDNGTGCTMWYGNEYRDPLIDDRAQVPVRYVLVSAKSSKGKKWKWIVIAIAIFLGLVSLSALWYARIRKLRLEEEEKKRRKECVLALTASDSFNDANDVQNNGREGQDFNIFSFASIGAATNNFSHENKLGEGGFGPVYKGQLPDGREIAVKRLSSTSQQGLVEFKNELILIAKLQHTNLVRVLGCCLHGEEKMLIYEYMPNKSLDSFLFDTSKRELIDWKKRFNIIEGVAQGLLYLHKYSRMRVIHRDLQASNVLLDYNMNPKIADFGMARIFKSNETEAMTKRVVGTYGYMAPEYAMEGTFSVKSDVFSFGVSLLEIVSGWRNSTFYHLDRPLNLIGYAWELWKKGNALELKDPILGDSCAVHEVLRTIHVGLLCVQESATDRPTISDVISMLSNESMPLPPPNQPAFFTGRSAPESTSSQTKTKECSVNNLTITVMDAR